MAVDVSIYKIRVDDGYLSTVAGGDTRNVGISTYSGAVTSGGRTRGAVYRTGTQRISGIKIFDGSIRIPSIIPDTSTSKVVFTDPCTGDLMYADASFGTTINTLSDVGDVSVAGITTNQILQWTGLYWEPTDSSGIGSTSFEDLTDTSVNAPPNDLSGVMYFNAGNKWMDVSTLDITSLFYTKTEIDALLAAVVGGTYP